ncbi:MAG TPA: PIN domain-containing protein [bacterium]|nr:PIN domain-containing protein [bacterium]
MRFWDASAIIPLCVAQPWSATARALWREDPGMVVWWGTSVECGSVLARLGRAGALAGGKEDIARGLLRDLERAWIEILPNEEVRAYAGRLVRSHALRTLDALQLAAALSWMKLPEGGEIVVLDPRLAQAARIEGLTARP